MKEINFTTTMIDGLPIAEKSKVQVVLEKEFIILNEIKQKGFKFETLNTFKIKIENVLDIAVATEKEIINMNKSVIGRGAVGMLFGPVGAILGGMSGLGTKQIVKKKDTLCVISYMNKDEEIKNITLKVNNITEKAIAKTFSFIVKQNYIKERESKIKMLTGQNIEL